jgi:hypothetical protein
MPELRLVVLATQDRLAYATRFPEALAQLLAGARLVTTTSAETAQTPQQPPPAGSAASNDVRNLVQRANQALEDYRRLTSEGKLGEAGAKLDELQRTIEEMNRAAPRQ